jgi:integrase
MPLTDTQIRNAKKKASGYRLYDERGLYLQVVPSGGKLWRFRFSYADKEGLLALGRYPDLSLSQAREKRDLARNVLANGGNPAEAKQKAKQERKEKAQNTFKKLFVEWHENQRARWTEKYGANITHRMETDIFPDMGGMPVNDITPQQLLRTIRKVESRGANEVARRTLQVCGQVFKYAIITGKAERNPAADIVGALEPYQKTHYAALEAKDIPDFVKALERNDARLYPLTILAVKFMMLTFVRTGELIAARWEEFDLDEAQWNIPAERMKMRKPHIVPLSKQAVVVLQEVQKLTHSKGKGFVFPSQIRAHKHMSNGTVLMALKRLGYARKMTGHGFRALAMSAIKEKLGYRHEVVDRQLAHAPKDKVDRAYDRAQFLDERKRMMQGWADYLDGCLEKQSNVVRGKFGRDKTAA